MVRTMYCQVCERHRDDHTAPFGARCTMPPLDQDALEQARAARKAAEEQVKKATGKGREADDGVEEDENDDEAIEAQMVS